MKNILLLLLVLPLPAAAQRGRPPEADQVTLTTAFSGRGGFDSRSAGFKAAFGLGRLGPFAFSGQAGAAHVRTWSAGYFPGEVYETDLGLAARGGKWNLLAGARSNSDRPYNSVSETDLNLDASRALGRRGPHSFLLGLNYSSRRSFLRGLPFPYLSYTYTTERLTLFLPFRLRWLPAEGTEVSASYFPPSYFSASVSRRLAPWLTLAATGGRQLSQYLPAGRADKDQALFLEQPYAGLRATVVPAAGWEAALQGNWGFRGRYYTGEQYDDRHGKTGVDEGPSVSLSVKRQF